MRINQLTRNDTNIKSLINYILNDPGNERLNIYVDLIRYLRENDWKLDCFVLIHETLKLGIFLVQPEN